MAKDTNPSPDAIDQALKSPEQVRDEANAALLKRIEDLERRLAESKSAPAGDIPIIGSAPTRPATDKKATYFHHSGPGLVGVPVVTSESYKVTTQDADGNDIEIEVADLFKPGAKQPFCTGCPSTYLPKDGHWKAA